MNIEKFTEAKLHEDGYPQLVFDQEYLSQECDEVEGNEEGIEAMVEALEHVLIREEGIALSAPQIGIRKRLSIIGVQDPHVLVNPVIKKKENKIPYVEGCLSFPDEAVRTIRYSYIEVETGPPGDRETVSYGLNADQVQEFLKNADQDDSLLDDLDLLEAVAVQHEVDHLNGVLMFDRQWKYVPQKPFVKDKEQSFGRNERVKMFNPKNQKEIDIKWKFGKRKLDEGWILV